MSEISHNSIFEFLSIDTGISETELLSKLSSLGVPEFIKFLENNSSALFSNETSLCKDLCDMDGKVLISHKARLSSHLPVLFERYCKEKRFRTSEVLVHVGGPVLQAYQKVLRFRLLNMYETFIMRDSRYKDVAKNWLNESDAYNKYIRMFFDELVATPEGIAKAMEILRLKDSNENVLKEASAMLTFTLKVCMILISRKVILPDNKNMIMRLVGSGFFFYFLLRKINTVHPDINDEEKRRLMAYYATIHPSPLFKPNSKELLSVRVLITVHIFMSLLEKNNLTPESMDANRLMLYLSDAGYADYGIVNVLSEIFLPRVKHSVLEYAMRMKSKCNQQPVIWGIAGDMMPIRVICHKHDCQYASHHKTFIPSDVKICADMVFCTNIKKGVYYKCDQLTQKLETYFKSIIRKQENTVG